MAALLAALAIGVAFVPERVPALTPPDSPEAHDAMMRMMGPAMEEEHGKPGGSMQDKMDGQGGRMDNMGDRMP
jgi:hypothetical protein